jgi:hypothetical protein
VKWKLKAIWRILTCKGFYVINRRKDGSMFYLSDNLSLKDLTNVSWNIHDIITDMITADAVREAQGIIDATK